MIKARNPIVYALICSAFLTSGVLAGDKPKAPTGAERKRQFEAALKDCRKRFANSSVSVDVEWGIHYGRAGWWCHTRG
jgi:hypothetical protein